MLAVSTELIAGASLVAGLVLLVLIVAGTRRVRAEPPLDPDVEARLLLGEEPDVVESDGLQPPTAPVAELPRPDRR